MAQPKTLTQLAGADPRPFKLSERAPGDRFAVIAREAGEVIAGGPFAGLLGRG